MRIKALVPILFLLPFAAHSQECASTSPAVEHIFFTGAANQNDCAFVHRLTGTIGAVAQHFNTAPIISLVVGDKATNASFDNGKMIRVPQYLFSRDKSGHEISATEEQLMTVVIHEYGHALLNERWKVDFSEDFDTLFEDLLTVSEMGQHNFIHNIKSQGVRRSGQNVASSSGFAMYYKHMPAYQELYADALAVIINNNLSAMSEAMSFAKYHSALAVHLRDFAIQHSLESVESSKDEHTKLSIVRSYLGQRLLNLDTEKKFELLSQLENAITVVLKKNLANDQIPSIAQANQELIELLEQSRN